jgi:threonylcarbamoyladenosine tRNA methylthiotransferase MtaB
MPRDAPANRISEMRNRIKIFSLGCRLNALEAEKIRAMLAAAGAGPCVVINTCAVTSEALRQSRQRFHGIIRENPGIPVFITGCGATLRPDDFGAPNARLIPNKDKFNPAAYGLNAQNAEPRIESYEKMQKKGFVQIGDGCDRHCSYCITRILRGGAKHFPYDKILADARALTSNGYDEIILTGVNIADWKSPDGGGLAELCGKLLADMPKTARLTLSSMDPAAKDIESIMDLMAENPRMTPHLHLSAQSGCDEVLAKMGRRHNADRIRDIHNYGGGAAGKITFSWDIICGFPGETEEMFAETMELARELRPVKIHGFPFSARPGTAAAEMPGKIPRALAKERVRRITTIV